MVIRGSFMAIRVQKKKLSPRFQAQGELSIIV
jgi:hypothetical protein